ncbi:MAG: arabinogalactan endo-1,4-beta-galactosidase [Acidobacteriia bacterium]|nr:arabinogalactan endo-1,4-beta-galactosidase [Terriglobia bacterium]
MREERLRDRILFFILTFLIGAIGRSHGQEYAIGADVSFARQAEQQGIVFKENGVPTPVLEMLKAHGYNWVRLRIFHTPTDLPNDLDYTIASAKAAKKLGFRVLLDIHYSDTWADPAKQFTPKAWAGLKHDQLVKEVFAYTRDMIAAFRSADVLPDMVQAGNEIISGMLWPDGRLPDNWDNLAALLNAGIAGVAAGAGDRSHPRIMIHIDRGGDKNGTKYFFDKLNSYHVPYDVIGQSYYPWWHGSLKDLRDNLRFMAKQYKKDVFVVETAYNWKPTEYIKKKKAPFPESPEGQKKFLEEVNRVVQETPGGFGKGIFWWEPAVSPSPIRSRSFFDDNGNVLPAIAVFEQFARK